MAESSSNEKIYKVVKCKKYANRAKIGHLVTYGIWVATLFTNNPFDQFPALAAMITCSLLKGKFESDIFKSQEYMRYKKIYQIVLKKYVELNKKLDLKNPLEIFTLFNFAIRNNLFSITDSRICITSKQFDRPLIRELTLNNHGVCRHIASMLVDIYQNMGLESSLGVCLKPDMVKTIVDIDEEDKELLREMTERMNKMLEFEIDGEKINFEEIIKNPPKKIVLQPKPFTKAQQSMGNHAITLVNDNEFTYYLDPTNSNIFVPTEEENEMISEEGLKITMIPRSTIMHNYKYGIKDIEIKEVQKEGIILEQLCKTEQGLFDNRDVVGSFHEEIKEYLEEAEEIYQLILK